MLTVVDLDRVSTKTGQLHRAVFGGLPARRILYISEQLRLLLTGQAPGMNQKQIERWLVARAVLEQFVDGKWITVKSKPKSRAELAILCPHSDEIWEIRDVKPRPSLRILGSFAQKDLFVALAPYERSELGAKGSTEWTRALQQYKTQWTWLFGQERPISGSFPDDYLSNARHLD
jgi:hypothetical protein